MNDAGFMISASCAAMVPTAGELRQSGVLRHRCAYGRALSQVVVGIDVDDLIERTELGVPEGPQFGVFFPQGQSLRKAALQIRPRSRGSGYNIGASSSDRGWRG